MGIKWAEKNINELELFFSTDREKGHTKSSYRNARRQYGPNAIKSPLLEKNGFFGMEQKKRRSIKTILSRSLDVITILYILTSILFAALRINTYFPVVLPFIAFAAVFTFFLSESAESRLSRIYRLSRPRALVLRAGIRRYVFMENIVPGDLLILSAGDIVPADARIISANSLTCVHMSRSGRMRRLEKNDVVLNGIPDSPNYIAENMLFASDIITEGNAAAVTVATGSSTLIMRVSGTMSGAGRENEDSAETSSRLQTDVSSTARRYSLLSIFLSVLFILIGIIQRRDLSAVLMSALTLAVASYAEQMPVVADYALTYMMTRLSGAGILIKTPSVIDRINDADVFITKKNDSFTDEALYMSKINCDHWNYDVRTENLAKIGTILSYAALCSNVAVKQHGGRYRFQGPPVDTAVYTALERCGLDIKSLFAAYHKLEKVHSDDRSGIKYTLVESRDRFFIICFGEAENVLSRVGRRKAGDTFINFDSRYYNSQKQKIEELCRSYDLVTAVAVKECPYNSLGSLDTRISGLDLLGYICFSQPKQRGILENVTYLRKGGMDIVMGVDADNPSVHEAAKKFGVIQSGDINISDFLLDNYKIEHMGEGIFYATADKYRLTMPLSPENKLLHLKALRFRQRRPAAVLGEIADLPLSGEAELTIATQNTETGILTNRANVIMQSLGMNSFVQMVKGAVQTARSVHSSTAFFFASYISQYIFVLFALVSGGAYIFGAQQMIWAGLGIGLPLSAAVTLSQENTYWFMYRRQMAQVSPSGSQPVKKGISLSLFLSVPVLFSYFNTLISAYAQKKPAAEREFFEMLTRTFIEYRNTGALLGILSADVFRAASSAAFVTLFTAFVFAAVYSIKTHDFTDSKIFRNRILLFTCVCNAILLAVVLTVPPVREAFGFGDLEPLAFLAAVFCGFVPLTIRNLVLRR